MNKVHIVILSCISYTYYVVCLYFLCECQISCNKRKIFILTIVTTEFQIAEHLLHVLFLFFFVLLCLLCFLVFVVFVVF